MSTFRKRLLIGIGASSLGVGSVAAIAGGPGCGHMGGPHAFGDSGKGGERMRERMEKRAAELHDKLKLNASQENAWRTYVEKMKPAGSFARPDRAALEKMTAPERMEKMHALMKEREKFMAERVAATKEFYGVLTPEQQKVFDEQFQRGPGRRNMRR